MSDTKIIVTANQKGGAGKTTTAMQLAGSLSRIGCKVLVVDSDRQGTAVRWATADEEVPFPAHVMELSHAENKLHREVEKYVDQNFDFIIIDCPPAAESKAPRSALMVADLCIVPIIPSPLDLWSSVGIKEIIEEISINNEELKARLLLNQVELNRNLTKDIITFLNGFGIEMLKSRLGHRVIYRESAIFGKTVFDFGIKAARAIEEVENLTKEILDILSVNSKFPKKKSKHTKKAKR